MTYSNSAAVGPRSEAETPMHFFVSYTSADKAWAEWVGWILEENGQRVVMQAWDFRPGSNFVIEMQRAASKGARTIAILSADYLEFEIRCAGMGGRLCSRSGRIETLADPCPRARLQA